MSMPTLLELAQSGAHFGHHRSLTNPKAKTYIYMVKNNVALIDLEQTQNYLEAAQRALAGYLAEDKTVLVVGTRRLVRPIVKEIAQELRVNFITERWLGGFLTNFSNFSENISRMNKLEQYLESEDSAKIEKKERLVQEAKLANYHRFLGGVKSLTKLPDLLILASASEDKIAIVEANRLGIPIIAIADTDINPDLITYPIPANDDAPKAVELILRTLIVPIKTVTPKAKANSVATPETKITKSVSTKTETKKTKAVKKVTKPVKVKKTAVKK
jgi:small subunit ribosomal protein S2